MTYPVRVWVTGDVLGQVPTWHPIRDQSRRIESNTQKGDDVRMSQVFPDHSHLAKDLWDPCASGSGKLCHGIHTPLTFCGSPLECVRTRLMHTSESLKVASCRGSESVHALGSTALTPQILFSSSSSSRNGTLLGSEIPQRTCISGECEMVRNGVEAHAVQIVDKPSQILAL